MAKKNTGLTDDEAVVICRTPKPTPGRIKKVLAWAGESPASDKIFDLLLLQTDNYANRKGLASDFRAVLLACAESDPTPLWETIDYDWEEKRVWHALRLIALRKRPEEIQRLLKFARHPLGPIHWDVIHDAAEVAGLAVPDELDRFQKESLEGYAYIEFFRARKESWTHSEQGPSLAAPIPAKKPAEPDPVRLDGPLAPQEDDPPFVRKFRSSLVKRFKPTRMEELFQAHELAWYLTALDRLGDAETLLEYVTGAVEFTGNYNVWTPGGAAWVLLARLRRLRGDDVGAAGALDVIREHPYQHYDPSREAQEGELARLRFKLEEARGDKSQKWACHIAVRIVLSTASLFRETALPGFSHELTCPVDEFESLIEETQALLADRLR